MPAWVRWKKRRQPCLHICVLPFNSDIGGCLVSLWRCCWMQRKGTASRSRVPEEMRLHSFTDLWTISQSLCTTGQLTAPAHRSPAQATCNPNGCSKEVESLALTRVKLTPADELNRKLKDPLRLALFYPESVPRVDLTASNKSRQHESPLKQPAQCRPTWPVTLALWRGDNMPSAL